MCGAIQLFFSPHQMSEEQEPGIIANTEDASLHNKVNVIDNKIEGESVKTEIKKKRRKLIPLKKASINDRDVDKSTSFFRLRQDEKVKLSETQVTQGSKIDLNGKSKNSFEDKGENGTKVQIERFNDAIKTGVSQDKILTGSAIEDHSSNFKTRNNEGIETIKNTVQKCTSIGEKLLDKKAQSEGIYSHKLEQRYVSIEISSEDEDEKIILIDNDSDEIEEISDLVAEKSNSDIHLDGTYNEPSATQEFDELDPKLRKLIEERRLEKARQSQSVFEVKLEITSIFEGLDAEPLQLVMKNTDNFKGIRARYISFIMDCLHCSLDSEIYKTINECIFTWNGIQLFEFSTPNSLNIIEGNSEMNINATSIEQFKMHRQKLLMTLEDEASDDELIVDRAINEEHYENNQDTYFKIKLQSRDGNSLEVAVNPETEIKKLADYFIQKRGLPSSTQIRLEFDDEPLDLSCQVMDTELDEDYVVDVIL